MKNRVTPYLPAALLGLLIMFASASAVADAIDPNSPDGFVQVNRKIQCSLNDEEAVTYTRYACISPS